ncbi:hypothetical protein BH11VER1_BH11VER1_10670 [soil metagenome]
MSHVHLVIPCFCESSRIGKFLPALCEEMIALKDVSVLVVDDGSGAEEREAMQKLLMPLQEHFPCLKPPLFLPQNLGKGGAIYQGWHIHDNAEWLAFVDADGSCSAGEVKRLIELARSTPDKVGALFASRIKILGRTVDRQLRRHLIGRVYATLVSEGLDIPVYDSQCGLKLVRRRAFEKIKPVLQLNGFAFDIELLAALLDSGVKVEEMPIDWHETQGSKLHLVRDSIRMFRDVLMVRQRRFSLEWTSLMASQARPTPITHA